MELLADIWYSCGVLQGWVCSLNIDDFFRNMFITRLMTRRNLKCKKSNCDSVKVSPWFDISSRVSYGLVILKSFWFIFQYTCYVPTFLQLCFRKKGSRPIDHNKRESNKKKKCLSVGNFEIRSVVGGCSASLHQLM